MADSFTFEVPTVPKRPNGPDGFLRMHWTKRSKYFQGWQWEIRAVLPRGWSWEPPEFATVRIHQVRKGLLDKDNLYSSCKPCLDALIKLGLIKDDGPKYCDPIATQEKGKVLKTTFTIVRDK